MNIPLVFAAFNAFGRLLETSFDFFHPNVVIPFAALILERVWIY